MEFALSEEQLALQAAARDFARRELAPHAARWDQEEEFPRGALAKAGECGFCGIYMPEAHGGLGLRRMDAALIFEELAAGCTSTTAYLTIHNMVSWIVASWGQPPVLEQWAARLARGEALGSYCLTEPDAGSDAAALKTRAERDGDRSFLSGNKAFISGAGARTCWS